MIFAREIVWGLQRLTQKSHSHHNHLQRWVLSSCLQVLSQHYQKEFTALAKQGILAPNHQ